MMSALVVAVVSFVDRDVSSLGASSSIGLISEISVFETLVTSCSSKYIEV